MNPIVFPDTEDLLVRFLTVELGRFGRPVPVSVAVPRTRPTEFVLVPRQGGTRQTIVSDAPWIGVECWANTDGAALTLAQLTRGILHTLPGQMIDGHQFYAVNEVGGVAFAPDGESQQARYLFTLEIQVRGKQISPIP